MPNPFSETYKNKTTGDLLNLLQRVIQDTSNVGKMETVAIVEILNDRALSYGEEQEFERIVGSHKKESAPVLESTSIANGNVASNNTTYAPPPPITQPANMYSTNNNSFESSKNFEKTMERDTTLNILKDSNPVNHRSAYHQYTPDEVELFKNDNNTLILTSHRLFYQNASTTITLPVDEISFIGYKRKINYITMIIGGLLSIFGLAALTPGMGDSSLGLIVLLIGAALIYFSIKKYVVFASGGGEMVIEGDFRDLRAWIDRVFIAKETLIRQRKYN